MDAASAKSNGGSIATYKIVRRNETGRPEVLRAYDTTPIMPGDIIEVGSSKVSDKAVDKALEVGSPTRTTDCILWESMLHSLSGKLGSMVGVEGWMAAPGGLGMVMVAILCSSNSSLRRNGKLGKPADRETQPLIARSEDPGFAQAGRENR